MKILHVMQDVSGGLPAYVRNLAKGLSAAGVENRILAVRPEPRGIASAPHIEESEMGGIPGYRLSASAGDLTDPRYLCAHPDMEASFADLLRAAKPNVVHFHSLCGVPASLVQLAHVLGFAVVLTLHDVCALCRPYRFFLRDDGSECAGPLNGHACVSCNPDQKAAWLLERFRYGREVVNNCCDEVVAVSEYVRETHALYGYRKDIRILRHGTALTLRATPRRIAETPRLLFVGGLRPQKGLHVLLEALRQVPPEYYTLSVYGGGSRHQFESVIRPRFPSISMEYLDSYTPEDAAAVFDDHDLLIVPALGAEAAGLVLQEARARCLPVICSDAGGLPEYVIGGENGWLHPRGDVEILAHLLRERLANPGLLQGMADGLFQAPARRFADVAEDYRAIYANLADLKKPRLRPPAPNTASASNRGVMEFSPANHVRTHMGKIVAEFHRRRLGQTWVFGTGTVADLVAPHLEMAGIRVLGHFDNDPARQGTMRLGCPILAPMAADGNAIILAASSHAQILPQLHRLGFAADDIFLAYP
ncbi:MAG TPA: glycosyltransferase [Rhodocyclaceae bacterium]|nr:glycosyltransferase [Rhodocyclaceae bacterium]